MVYAVEEHNSYIPLRPYHADYAKEHNELTKATEIPEITPGVGQHKLIRKPCKRKE